MKFLIEKGVEVNLQIGSMIGITPLFGETPLNLAAEMGFIDIAAFLIKAGANVNIQDIYGRTPLYWAALSGNVDLIAAIVVGDPNLLLESWNNRNEIVLSEYSLTLRACRFSLDLYSDFMPALLKAYYPEKIEKN